MDWPRLLEDFKIPFKPSGRLWSNVQCPFCGDHGQHLGLHKDGAVNCFRCSTHGAIKTIAALLKVEYDQAREIAAKYGGASSYRTMSTEPKPPRLIRDIELPPGTKPLAEVFGAMAYLRKRNFDWLELRTTWGVMATGPKAVVQGNGRTMDYGYRLIVPVHYNGKLVTYQARDYTEKQQPKYLDCLPELESVPIKEILYGLDEAEGMDEAVLVEGVTDVWMGGPGTVGCLGIGYTQRQVMELASRFKRVATMLDPEPQATVKALSIARDLRNLGVWTHRLKLPKGKDPAETGREYLSNLKKGIWDEA